MTMNRTTLVCVVVLGLVLGALAQEEKWDDVSVDAILMNDALITSYVKCFLDMGPCTADGQAVKTRIRDAFETRCSMCTVLQRENIEKLIRNLRERRQMLWNDISARFDPTGELSKRFAQMA